MTDWQQPLGVWLTQEEGVSSIHQPIYEDRFGYAKDLNMLGAKIKVLSNCPTDAPCRFQDRNVPHYAEIEGPTALSHGGQFTVRDLRSGMVNIIAALVADGE